MLKPYVTGTGLLSVTSSSYYPPSLLSPGSRYVECWVSDSTQSFSHLPDFAVRFSVAYSFPLAAAAVTCLGSVGSCPVAEPLQVQYPPWTPCVGPSMSAACAVSDEVLTLGNSSVLTF